MHKQTSGSIAPMKRFYKVASSAKFDDGFCIQLDGKPVKTPLGQTLVAPVKTMADAIAAEWGAQEDDIVPDSMPLTQFLTTALDKARERDAITKTLTAYLDTDLVCYRTPEPLALLKRQEEAWDPIVEWFNDYFGEKLKTTKTLQALEQAEGAHRRVWNYIEALDEYYFAVLQICASVTGSIVVALAFMESEIDTDQVIKVSFVEEDYKAEIYKENEHGSSPDQEKSRAVVHQDIETAQRFLNFLEDMV